MRVSDGSSRFSGQRPRSAFSTRASSATSLLLTRPRMPASGIPIAGLPAMEPMDTITATPDITASGAGIGVPEKPTLDGLEDKWVQRWAAEDSYAFDRAA